MERAPSEKKVTKQDNITTFEATDLTTSKKTKVKNEMNNEAIKKCANA
jgi:hypothetical protein